MDQIPIGQQVTKTLKFRQPYPQFSVAPQWDIVNDANVVVLSGTAIISASDSNGWDITFTIPTNYESLTDRDILTLELYGTDVNGKTRSIEERFTLMDAADDYLPSIVLAMEGEEIEDSLILPASNIDATSITVDVQDHLGAFLIKGLQPTVSNILRVANRTDVPDRFTDREFRGFRYDFELPALKFPPLTRAPYQLVYKVRSTIPKLKTTEVHPLIRMNAKFFKFVSSLRMFLDQARLTEIDPTLQWHEDELALALINGIDHINAHPTVFTYWTVEDIPTPMNQVVEKSAALYALNRRYLAEGFNAFEFQGLSTSLTMDRRESIVYKIEELKAYLDTNLTLIKSNAINSFGKGTPDATVVNKEARVVLRTQNSPVHNRYGYGGFGAWSMYNGRSW